MSNSQLSQLKERNYYVRYIQKVLIEQILQDHFQERQDRLEILIEENTRLLCSPCPTFMYEGEFYRALNWPANREDNRAIHPQMMEQITEFIRGKDFNFTIQKSHVENYVANTLMFAKNTNDLFELIPGKFHTILREINPDMFNIGPAADKADIDQFKKTNHRGLVEFQRLFLEHLLLN